ncbi:ABC transporter ATP-binding protein [Lactonifactor longoviformis]|uniref:ABC transporter ATP-binding protein n=1 Tax=Lactonifactor longoviformis TaxID=341220 RepID=UPI001D013A22|nr:ABC transporter ATP-binding protein [Lactonifactor longoviformis]MCB5712324.1 ABC transporter ATP-binding protein/permease [Lactonifactor longoviformis]MCB5716368.1 ABC transporter ATP-binding protein/permease [Lactonifactor longoviformis]
MKQKDTLKRVLYFIRPYRGYVAVIFVFSLISVTFTLYAPILIGEGVDLILGKGQVLFDGVLKIIAKLGIIVAVTAVAQWFMNLATNHVTFCVVRDIRRKAFAHLEEVPVKYIDSNQPGEIMSRIVTDVDQFSDGLLMGFTQLFTGVVTIVGTLGFMLSIHVKITLIVVLITPVSLFVASFIAKRTFSMFKLQSETRGDMTSLVEELVGNQKLVQAFCYEKKAEERFQEVNEKLRVCGIRALFFSSITNPATRFVNGLVYTGVGIFGAFTVLNGGITVGQLSSFLNYANQYTKPFNEISGVVTELQNALACARRIFDFMDTPSVEPDSEDAAELKECDGSLELSHVYFSYFPGTSLLENINLNVKPGQRIAIVGPTGCGKTTLINLLMRFYDIDRGNIKVSGYEAGHVKRDSLRRQFGMVLQDTWLRSGTIAENIAYGRPEASREEILEAAKAAYAHSFIKRMKNGYDTVITEDGGNLSQGQKQLLCIARVMLLKPPMLILDEATSSIDTRTEIKIQQAFEKLMEGRTSFIVAHRLSTIKSADVILVMKDGNIIEQGNHEELLEENGFYAKLYESQFAVS